jgi:hypothetical protein
MIVKVFCECELLHNSHRGFCATPASHRIYVNSVRVDLCDGCYQYHLHLERKFNNPCPQNPKLRRRK